MGQDGRSGSDGISDCHGGFPLRSEEDIDARTEFDKADALCGAQGVSGLFVADDAAGNQASDLAANNACAGAFDHESILLVVE